MSATLFAAAAPAMAQADEETVVISTNHAVGTTTRSVAVSQHDLNLADGRDVARLQRRIADAADRVCANQGLWNRFDGIEYRNCYNSAVANAMAHVMSEASGSN